MAAVADVTATSSSREKFVDVKYRRYVTNIAEHFYRSNLFVTLLLLTIIHLLSGNYALILCNVLCTLPPGILTYFQTDSKSSTIKKWTIVYWLICGLSFAFDTVCASSISSYSYIKIVSLMLLFYYCMMANGNNKHVPCKNTRSERRRQLNQSKRNSKEWIANKQSQYGRTSEDLTSCVVGRDETTLKSLKTISKESCNLIRLNSTAHSTAQLRTSGTAKSGRMSEVESTESLVLAAAIGETFEDHQVFDWKRNAGRSVEGLVSFPDSQVTLRNGPTGPVILSFTNNYKKSVMWALKTNAIRRLAAFPTAGIIPPSQTVQVKIDLIGQIPKRKCKDRLSLEYFIIDRQVARDSSNSYSFFHRSKSTRMRKCLEVIYIE
ncbi:unnamed protein product [Litomosoides sigmodontis]|uniref:Major sperm protein n=1 Tax=Litomosoides sigmodontis TaxID=42156 RepID=A0A3P6S9Q9_LITSI|nr:unnamed protein product [Litomosoides sigmodontis]